MTSTFRRAGLDFFYCQSVPKIIRSCLFTFCHGRLKQTNQIHIKIFSVLNDVLGCGHVVNFYEIGSQVHGFDNCNSSGLIERAGSKIGVRYMSILIKDVIMEMVIFGKKLGKSVNRDSCCCEIGKKIRDDYLFPWKHLRGSKFATILFSSIF
jgi:hypothetical protein